MARDMEHVKEFILKLERFTATVEMEVNLPGKAPSVISCKACFGTTEVTFVLGVMDPHRLQHYALQAVANVIDVPRKSMLDVNHCQSLESILPDLTHPGVVKDFALTLLHRHVHEQLNWTSTKVGLEKLLNCIAVVESEYKKPISDEEMPSTAQDDETSEVQKFLSQELLDKYVPNIFTICAALCRYKNQQAPNPVEDIPERLQALEGLKHAVEQFLSTGPHICLDEKECEMIKDFVQRVPPVLANELTDLLTSPFWCGTPKARKMLESVVHPAVTRIKVPCLSEVVNQHMFLKIVPTLKNLQEITLTITTLEDEEEDRRYLKKTDEEILKSFSSNCQLLKELSFHAVPANETYTKDGFCDFSQALMQLPTSLRKLRLHGSSGSCSIVDLDAMADSGRFSSLYCLSLVGLTCDSLLKTGFQSLAVLEVEKFFYDSSFYLKDIGSQLRSVSLTFVYTLKLQDLAKACPELQYLKVKNCSLVYDYAEPEPEFKSLRELHFICNCFHTTYDAYFIALLLKHSFKLQKLELFTKEPSFSACLNYLLQNKSIYMLTEVVMYGYSNKDLWGLLTREIVDDLFKCCADLCVVGGINSPETRNELSLIYPTVTFSCVDANLRKYCLEERMRFLDDRALFPECCESMAKNPKRFKKYHP